MSVQFAVGDHVSWNSEAGRVSGTITKVHTKDLPAGWLSRTGRVSDSAGRDRMPDGLRVCCLRILKQGRTRECSRASTAG